MYVNLENLILLMLLKYKLIETTLNSETFSQKRHLPTFPAFKWNATTVMLQPNVCIGACTSP